MVIQSGNLEQTLQEVEKYLKQEGFTIFYGVEATRSRYLAEVLWAEEKSGWKGFLQAAKEAGAKVVVVQASSLEEKELQAMLLEGEQEEALRELRKHVGKVSYFSLFWVKDGIKYAFSQATDWWEELSALRMEGKYAPSVAREGETRPLLMGRYGILAQEIPEEIKKKSHEQLADEMVAFIDKEFPEARLSYFGRPHEAEQLFWESKGLKTAYVDDPQVRIKIRRAELLAEEKWRRGEGKVATDFAKKSEEELAHELVEFMKKEFPGEEKRVSYRANNLFWQSKGVETRVFPRDPKVELKVEKVESLARHILDQEMQKREKEAIPKLAEECVKWAKENGLRKVTKANVDYFLTEKDQTLSKPSRDAIYNKVNLILAK